MAIQVMATAVAEAAKEIVRNAPINESSQVFEGDLAVDAIGETNEISTNDPGIDGQLETIETNSLDSLVERNLVRESELGLRWKTGEHDAGFNSTEVRESQLSRNREVGRMREEEAARELQTKYPTGDGYEVQRERYLVGENGNIIKDPETGGARRLDFVVIRDGKVVKAIERLGASSSRT